jgi:cytochrome P450
MADLGFAQDSGMQDGKGDPSYMQFIHDYMRTTATVASLRNLCQLIPYIPSDSDTKEFRRKCENMLENRLAMGKSRRDVFTHLLNEDAVSGLTFTKSQLSSNAQLMIVAGSGGCF